MYETAVDHASLTGAQGVARVIARQKRPIVFGMPGGYTMHIYDALFDLGAAVETHLVRQESLATVAAEAQGRLTGRPAFVIAQGAWVLGNAGIGIMEAHLGASPMVLLIDATDGGAYSHLGPYQAGFGGHGAYDLPAAMRAITKQTFVASDPVQAVQMTQLAVKHATAGEPGPVAVIFHGRSLFERIGTAAGPPVHFDRGYDNPGPAVAPQIQIDAAAQALRDAGRVAIVAGNGVRLAAAESALLAFAEAAGIPVATTPAGKGTFPEDHPLALGVIGAFGHETANAVVGDAEVVLVVGSKLGATDTANLHPALIDAARQTIVQIDVEPLNLSWTFPVQHLVHGDADDALTRLRTAVAGWSIPGRDTVAAARAEHPFYARELTSAPGVLDGRDAVTILSRELPADTVVTCDAGENRLFVLRDFQSKAGGTVLQPKGGGGMGYAIPAALAAVINLPGRPAVAVCGDGGVAMSLHGLVSAVELGVTMTVVVLDNTVLGWVYNGQRGRVVASEFSKSFDYAAIAAAIGCHAVRARTVEEFRAAVVESRTRAGVSVIVAATTLTDRYQDIMSSLNSHDVYAVPDRG